MAISRTLTRRSAGLGLTAAVAVGGLIAAPVAANATTVGNCNQIAASATAAPSNALVCVTLKGKIKDSVTGSPIANDTVSVQYIADPVNHPTVTTTVTPTGLASTGLTDAINGTTDPTGKYSLTFPIGTANQPSGLYIVVQSGLNAANPTVGLGYPAGAVGAFTLLSQAPIIPNPSDSTDWSPTGPIVQAFAAGAKAGIYSVQDAGLSTLQGWGAWDVCVGTAFATIQAGGSADPTACDTNPGRPASAPTNIGTTTANTAALDSSAMAVPVAKLASKGGAPTVNGTNAVGHTLKAAAGSSAFNYPDVAAGRTYVPMLGWQWYANGKAIAGATGSAYKVSAAHAGQVISVKRTATSTLHEPGVAMTLAKYTAYSPAASAGTAAKATSKTRLKVVAKKGKLIITVHVSGAGLKATGLVGVGAAGKSKVVHLKKGAARVVFKGLKKGKTKAFAGYFGAKAFTSSAAIKAAKVK